MAHKHDLTWSRILIIVLAGIVLLPFLPMILLGLFGFAAYFLIKKVL